MIKWHHFQVVGTLPFGWIFSGTLNIGEKLRIMGSNYKYGKKEDLFNYVVSPIYLMMKKKPESIYNVPCGNIVCLLIGVDEYLLKTGTISNDPESHLLRSMKFSFSHFVRAAI